MHSKSTFKSDNHGNEQQIERGKMEVDSVVALKYDLLNLK
jgi:hypothetical protein